MDSFNRAFLAILVTLALASVGVADPPKEPIGDENSANSPPSMVHVAFRVLRLQAGELRNPRSPLDGELGLEPGSALAIETAKAEKLVATLLDRQAANVVAEPRIVTKFGRSAKIETGRQPDGNAAPEIPRSDPSHVGLAIECLVRRGDDSSRMELFIDFTQSTANPGQATRGKEQLPAEIVSQNLRTTVEVAAGESVIARGPRSATVLVATPTLVEDPPTPSVKQARFRVPPPLPAVIPSPRGMLGELVRVKAVIESVADDSAIEIRLERDHFEIEVVVAEETTLQQLADTIATLPSIRVEAVKYETLGRGAKLYVVGRRATNRADTNRDDVRMLRQEIGGLKTAIEELTRSIDER